jgi:predicted amidohydrolase
MQGPVSVTEQASLSAVLAQIAPEGIDAERNAERAAEIVREHSASDIVVFPELFITGYEPAMAGEAACDPDGPEISLLASVCEETATAAVVGFAEKLDSGAVANATAAIDESGSLVAVYRKTHLFGTEIGAFTAGSELCLARLVGLEAGLLTCFDAEFPEPARALARAGAELLITCSANMDPYGPWHEVAIPARALENRLPHIYVNRVGEQGGAKFAGLSMAVDASGNVLVKAGGQQEILTAEIPIQVDTAGEADYLSQIREDLPVARAGGRNKVVSDG